MHYAYKFKPFMINNIFYQLLLWDRRAVYAMLRKYNIPVPNYV